MGFALKNRLLGVMDQRAQSRGIKLTPGCRQALEGLVCNAIERMIISKVADRSDKQRQAEQNLAALLDRVADKALALGRYPTIDEIDLVATKADGCALWPFL